MKLFFSFSMLFLITAHLSATGADVEDAIQSIQENGYSAQHLLYKAVFDTGLDSLSVLKYYSRDTNAATRDLIYQAFYWMKAPCEDISNEITQGLNDSNNLVRYAAVAFIAGQECSSHKNGIINLLKSETDVLTRVLAIKTIGIIGDASDTEYLNNIQSNNPLREKMAASYALSRLDQPFDISVIKEGLNSGNEKIQLEGLKCLAGSSNLNHVALLEPFFTQSFRLASVARISAISIKRNVQSSEIDKLSVLLDGMRDENSDVRRWAAHEIASTLPRDVALNALKQIVQDSSHPGRMDAAGALERKKFMTTEELMQLLEN